MDGRYFVDCLRCKGAGWVREPDGYGCVQNETCFDCEGTGKEECTEEIYEQIVNAGAIK